MKMSATIIIEIHDEVIDETLNDFPQWVCDRFKYKIGD